MDFDPDYVDPEVEPLEEDADSKLLGSSGQTKVVGSSGRWVVGWSFRMTYMQKTWCLQIARDSFRANGFKRSNAAMQTKLTREIGGSWNCYLIKGTYGQDFVAHLDHHKKYICCRNGSYNFVCIQVA